jgi:hypothetical protein
MDFEFLYLDTSAFLQFVSAVLLRSCGSTRYYNLVFIVSVALDCMCPLWSLQLNPLSYCSVAVPAWGCFAFDDWAAAASLKPSPSSFAEDPVRDINLAALALASLLRSLAFFLPAADISLLPRATPPLPARPLMQIL